MEKLKSIIFWGACWGILEATLGWFLHLIHFKGEVFILYPFGLMCMMMAARQTAQLSAVIKVAGVASLVKLINLFMLPAVPVYHVTNPAVAIFLEGLVTWGFCFYMQKKPSRWMSGILVASVLVFASIFVFRGWQIVMDAYVTYNPGIHKPFEMSVMAQWSWRSLVQGSMLIGAVYLMKFIPIPINSTKWTSRLALPFLLLSVILSTLLK